MYGTYKNNTILLKIIHVIYVYINSMQKTCDSIKPHKGKFTNHHSVQRKPLVICQCVPGHLSSVKTEVQYHFID